MLNLMGEILLIIFILFTLFLMIYSFLTNLEMDKQFKSIMKQIEDDMRERLNNSIENSLEDKEDQE